MDVRKLIVYPPICFRQGTVQGPFVKRGSQVVGSTDNAIVKWGRNASLPEGDSDY